MCWVRSRFAFQAIHGSKMTAGAFKEGTIITEAMQEETRVNRRI